MERDRANRFRRLALSTVFAMGVSRTGVLVQETGFNPDIGTHSSVPSAISLPIQERRGVFIEEQRVSDKT